MGIIVNPRGTNGAGKTTLVRRLIAEQAMAGPLVPICRPGRSEPLGYRFEHSAVVVLGHYERRSGGCDTITLRDGGLDEIVRLADGYAVAGARVLLEGALLSEERVRSAELARTHRLHVLLLDTTTEQCVRNLMARRHLPRGAPDRLRIAVETRRIAVAAACEALQAAGALIEQVAPETAYRSARALLTGT